MKRSADVAVLLLLVVTPIAYVWRYAHGSTAAGIISYDIYSYAYPIMLQAVAAAHEGGRGLLWNALQNCGQPFFGTGTTGLLYPGNLFFFVLNPDWALYALLVFNFSIGCISAYFLCRQLGTGRIAACCGGLAFGLGTSSIDVNTSTPIISGAYVWFPAAVLFCERILRTPSALNAVGLGLTIAVSLIPGHPQFVLYLYQFIAARFLWELVTRPRDVSLRTVLVLGTGLVLGPLLIAVQLLPVIEVTRESIRSRALAPEELAAGKFLTWKALRGAFAWRWDNGHPFLVVPYVMAAASLLFAPGRRVMVFYLAIAVMVIDLSLGANGFLFPFYSRLPFVSLFRDPRRMLVLTAFCVAVLAAAGVEAAVAPPRGSRARVSRARAAAAIGLLLIAGLLGMRWLAPTGLSPQEWWLAGTVVAAGLLATVSPGLRPIMGTTMIAALVLHLVVYRTLPLRELLPDGTALFSKRPVFARLQERMTAQDRIYLVPSPGDHSLQQKTGSLFGIPAILDYHSQTAQRYADFVSTLRLGRPARNFNEWSYPVTGLLPTTFNRRLLNLAAGRYLVVPIAADRTAILQPPPALIEEFSAEQVRIYENRAALPRALWVPRLEVIPDAPELLSRLAAGKDDPYQVAFVEELPPSGFLGSPAPESQPNVTFLTNDPERVSLGVQAPARGFVFLADQYFPGWRATVNGSAVPILRANYVFRLVEVPAGKSIVELRYSPASVKLGALISAITSCFVAAIVWRKVTGPG